jgi:hypothetical protein
MATAATVIRTRMTAIVTTSVPNGSASKAAIVGRIARPLGVRIREVPGGRGEASDRLRVHDIAGSGRRFTGEALAQGSSLLYSSWIAP